MLTEIVFLLSIQYRLQMKNLILLFTLLLLLYTKLLNFDFLIPYILHANRILDPLEFLGNLKDQIILVLFSNVFKHLSTNCDLLNRNILKIHSLLEKKELLSQRDHLNLLYPKRGVQNFYFQIQCILYENRLLLVGTNQGTYLVYNN